MSTPTISTISVSDAKTINRSTLSRCNNTLNPQILKDTLNRLIAQLQGSIKREASDIVRMMDSSIINLLGPGFAWAEKEKTMKNRGLKLHVVYDESLCSPVTVDITDPTVSDPKQARQWALEPGVIYVFDRGYYSYQWWQALCAQGVHIVTRLKKNSQRQVIESFVPVGEHILSDARVRLHSKRDKVSVELRCIEVAREGGQGPLLLVTDRFDLSAQEVSDLYKRRWQIELFFKWIKQRMQVKRFLGRSRNAVIVQLLAALIAYVLLVLYKRYTRAQVSLTSLMRKVQSTLMSPDKDYTQRRERDKPPTTQQSFPFYTQPILMRQ